MKWNNKLVIVLIVFFFLVLSFGVVFVGYYWGNNDGMW